MEYKVDRHGDTTITIRKLRIKDIERWNKMSAKDFVAKGVVEQDESRTGSLIEEPADNETEIECQTDITYH